MSGDRAESEYQAREKILANITAFVREARRAGWAPDKLLPPVAWRLAEAVRQTEIYVDLRGEKEEKIDS